MLAEAYGDETLSNTHVFEWYKRFSERRVSAEDDEPAGCTRGRCSDKNGKFPKESSKNFVPELLPVMAAPNAEVSECRMELPWR
ncbi:hypothetical protein TNCV_4019541 [Trichonephila clavipes]|nr:hypothetical protein TNCV_4019541 [Trichonephila clavipes]